MGHSIRSSSCFDLEEQVRSSILISEPEALFCVYGELHSISVNILYYFAQNQKEKDTETISEKIL